MVFKEYQVLPKSDWNYALDLDFKNIGKSISVNKKDMPENPFVSIINTSNA